MSNIPKKIHYPVVLIIAVIIVIIAFALSHNKKAPQTKAVAIPNHLDTTPPVFAKQKTIPPRWKLVFVKSGDTLKSIFSELNIPSNELWQLLQLKNPAIVQLHPNQKLHFLLDQHNQLLTLTIPIAREKVLQIDRAGKRFKQTTKQLPVDTVTSYKSGVVTTSFAMAARKAGLNTHMYYQLVKMFEGQVNFRRSIHRNDSFSILYQEKYLDGHKVGPGEILAAELKTKEQTYHAIRFTDHKNNSGYYTPNGHSVEPRFLSYPVKFKRISSHFNYKRLDPILHRIHPHLGVDFAAYSGTPIRSIGNGRITFIGRDHGYGNAIKIRYDRHYSALYAHMKGFAKGLKTHQYIRKGQVIGYVGSTGWSTGPHLHFGFYVNGSPKDWLALKPPTDAPIPYRDHRKFKHTAKTLLAVLRLHQTTELAENSRKAIDTPRKRT